ncbi:MAG: ABC transporter ATP-binding protein [Candidatus Lokiarchaeota archaeon]|nr:ABC transporter ATP-binding protein [Candidatus Lokiarchaeota archaeon]
MVLLEVKNLTKDYYKKDGGVIPVLSDINFSIRKGETFAIIGPNGSGKTTLLRILGLLESPTQGEVQYRGRDVINLSRKHKTQYRRELSFVRQKPLVRDASVFDNIAFGLKVRGLKLKQYKNSVEDMIKRVGLSGMKNKSARSLSGGEMQRVVIAMNFIITPEIYLLDEVSANLDPVNVKILDNFINEIKQDKQKTIVLSTHDRYEAIRLADRIAVLNEGTIKQINTPSLIFQSPKDEFTAQFVGYENIFGGVASIDLKTHLNHVKINDLVITTSSQKEGKVKVCIHPESIIIAKNAPQNVSSLNLFKGKVEEVRDLGNLIHVVIRTNSEKFLVSITKLSQQKLEIKNGSEVYINFKATDVKIL